MGNKYTTCQEAFPHRWKLHWSICLRDWRFGLLAGVVGRPLKSLLGSVVFAFDQIFNVCSCCRMPGGAEWLGSQRCPVHSFLGMFTGISCDESGQWSCGLNQDYPGTGCCLLSELLRSLVLVWGFSVLRQRNLHFTWCRSQCQLVCCRWGLTNGMYTGLGKVQEAKSLSWLT